MQKERERDKKERAGARERGRERNKEREREREREIRKIKRDWEEEIRRDTERSCMVSNERTDQ